MAKRKKKKSNKSTPVELKKPSLLRRWWKRLTAITVLVSGGGVATFLRYGRDGLEVAANIAEAKNLVPSQASNPDPSRVRLENVVVEGSSVVADGVVTIISSDGGVSRKSMGIELENSLVTEGGLLEVHQNGVPAAGQVGVKAKGSLIEGTVNVHQNADPE